MKALKIHSNQIVILLLNFLILFLWGFAGLGKASGGLAVPEWFVNTFKDSPLAHFPGLSLSYYLIVVAELTAFILAMASLCRLEFRKAKMPFLRFSLLLSVSNFLMLEFGVMMVGDHTRQASLFNYFVLCLIMYAFVDRHESVASELFSKKASIRPK